MADGTCVFFFVVLVHPVYSKFWLCDYYREMKKCQCYLIYDKANGDVARLEWVGDLMQTLGNQ